MEMKTVVAFEDGEAHYSIYHEALGIYQARLVQYNGVGNKPPQEVVLVKGFRQWSGSCNRREILNQLGKAIERRMRNGDPSNSSQP